MSSDPETDPDLGEQQADPETQETTPRSESPETPVEDVGAIFDPRPDKSILEAVETISDAPKNPEDLQETAENFMADEASPELERLAEDLGRKSPSTPEAVGDGLAYEVHPEKPEISEAETPVGQTAENLMEEEGNPEVERLEEKLRASPETPVEELEISTNPQSGKSKIEVFEAIPEPKTDPKHTASGFMAQEANPEVENLEEKLGRSSPSTPIDDSKPLEYGNEATKPDIPEAEAPEGHTAENLMEQEANPELPKLQEDIVLPGTPRKLSPTLKNSPPISPNPDTLENVKYFRHQPSEEISNPVIRKPGFEVVVEPNEDDLAAMENGVGASKNNLLVLGTGPKKVEPVPEEMPETEADAILEAIVESQAEEAKPGPEVLSGIAERQLESPKLEEVPKIDSPVEKDYQKELPKLVMSAQHPDSRANDSPAAETPVDPRSKFKFPLKPARKISKERHTSWKDDVHMEAPPAEPIKEEADAVFRFTPKKQVSILVSKPPSDENIPERRRLMGDAIAPSDSASNYDEKTPLLASTSLPTVCGDETLPIHPTSLEPSVFDEPISSARSEGWGPTNPRRQRRRSRLRSENALEPSKARPFIASPFMPMLPVRKSTIDLERRSTLTREPRSYGSVRNATRRMEEVPILPRAAEESETESESEISRKGSFLALSSRDWITVTMLAIANLCSTIAFSCIAPFYPAEAALKGMSEAETGIVFGIFELTMFICAPLFGKFMTKIGSKNMFTMGLAITGITAICFGFLNYLPAGNRLFFWASLLIRIAEAVGDAAFVTSSFAISAKLFPGHVASIVGVMETFAGLGYTAGPLVGGFLYEYGGFQTPFLVLGGTLLVATGLSVFTIEALDEDTDDIDTDKGMMAMLKIPLIWIMSYAVVICALSLSFLDPTLEAHLRTFSLTPTVVGLMFLLCGGVYTLSAPFWGVLIDKFDCSIFIMFFGSAATAVSMVIIGPSPLIPIDKNLWVIGFALCILGVAAGALYIPTFQNCLDAVKEYDFDDSIYTYGCVSGIFQSAFAFGGFIGPTLGGAAVQWIGFEWTSTAIAIVNVIFIITLLFYYGTKSMRQRSIQRILE